jgi:hypothetical protein
MISFSFVSGSVSISDDHMFAGQVNIGLEIVVWDDLPDAEELAREREEEMKRLFVKHRAYVHGTPQVMQDIPKSRHDLRKHYGEIIDRTIPTPDWVDAGARIQFNLPET